MALLNKEAEASLSTWIANDQQKRGKFELLYKATRDQLNATIFHQKCDNKGPTVTIAKNTANYVFGGFTSASWKSSGKYSNDSSAFLFRLSIGGIVQAQKYNVKSAQYALYNDASYGPTFGGSHDLYLFAHNPAMTGSYWQGEYCKAGHSYPCTKADLLGDNMQLTEVEVYQVVIKDKKVLEDKPWRHISDGWSSKVRTHLIAEVAQYKPLCPDVPNARILMLGPVGAGKSSFFNTIQSVFRGQVTAQAYSGNSQHSLTKSYRTYTVKASSGGVPYSFLLADTMGLEEELGLNAADVAYILDGHVPDRFQFNPVQRISSASHGFIKETTLATHIHSVVLILDSNTVDMLSKNMLDKLRAIQEICIQKGIPVSIVLTKIDKLCPSIAEDLETVFHSQEVEKAVSNSAEKFGLPLNHVLPVKNYEAELESVLSVDILTLLAIRQILKFTSDYFEEQLDLTNELEGATGGH